MGRRIRPKPATPEREGLQDVLSCKNGTRVRVEVGSHSVIVGTIRAPLGRAPFGFEILPDGADHALRIMEPDVRAAAVLPVN